MESRISLALANKLRMLFEREDKFLTYPLGVGFDYRYLSFMKDPAVSGLTLQEQLNDRGDFARLMNFIPDDSPTYSPDSSRLLWNVTKTVLIGANYPSSGLTPAETAQLDAAIAYLTDEETAEDGSKVLVYSAAVRKYYEHKTVYEAAEMTYLDEKITVESTTGPEGERLKAQWSAYREQQLREARDKAMQDWKSLGFKLQVENHQAIQRQLEPKKFLHLEGQAYLSDIELSELPDLTGNPIGFCSTFFSPSDVFDPNTAWNRLNLTRAEIDTLVQSAPANIQALFGGAQRADDGIVSISIEYNNVPIMRPWFRPEFFESKCWKLADGGVVSSGATPRQGLIPAYVTSILVVRNLTITRRKAAAQQPVTLPILGEKPLGDLKFDPATKLDTKKLLNERLAAREKLLKQARRPSPVAKSTDAAGMLKRGFPGKGALPRPPEQPVVQPMMDRSTLLESLSKTIQPLQREEFLDAKYRGTTIKTPPFQIPPRQPEPSSPPTEEVIVESHTLPGVAVLAFLCKRVPKAPNPDLTLTWVG